MRDGVLFSSIFDARFAARWLAMHRSLAAHVPGMRMCVLCLDDVSGSMVERLGVPGVSVLTLAELEARDPELVAAKDTRAPREYISVARPCFLLRLLEDERPRALVYVDADLMFFADPDPFLRELDSGSVVLVPQWHSDEKRQLDEVFGIYNAGTIAFRSDADGLGAARRWREQCLEWTGFTPQPGRFGNQRYLNEWPAEQRGVHVASDIGLGVAPWNVERYELARGAKPGEVLVDGVPLVFYHHSGVSIAGGPRPLLWLLSLTHALRFQRGAVPFTWGHHWHRIPARERELVWEPYMRAVAGALETMGYDARTGLESPWRQLREVVLRRRVLWGAGHALRRLLWRMRAHGALRRVEALRKRWGIE